MKMPTRSPNDSYHTWRKTLWGRLQLRVNIDRFWAHPMERGPERHYRLNLLIDWNAR